MEFETHSHRFGLAIADGSKFKEEWDEIKDSVNSISDKQIISCHKSKFKRNKSISKAVNHLIHEKLTQ